MDRPAEAPPVRYVGFWVRSLASVVDIILSSIVLAPLGALLKVEVDTGLDLGSGFQLDWHGISQMLRPHSLASFTVNVLLPAVAVLAFWFTRGSTPGKMIFSAVIVDARTLGRPGQGQLVARYLAYYVSLLAFGLGFLWIAFDRRKQGWHDKIAGTVVIRKPR